MKQRKFKKERNTRPMNHWGKKWTFDDKDFFVMEKA